MATPMNDTRFNPRQIQYLPRHRCPKCGARPVIMSTGGWFQPYQDWFNTVLGNWQAYLGYVRFQCNCQHHPEFRGVLRVVRLGDAILPVHFADLAAAREIGLEPAQINAQRTRQALAFLAAHADPAYTQGTDWPAQRLSALAETPPV